MLAWRWRPGRRVPEGAPRQRDGHGHALHVERHRVTVRDGPAAAARDEGCGVEPRGSMAYTLLDMAQARWRRLNGAHLLPLVRAGIGFMDGPAGGEGHQDESTSGLTTRRAPPPGSIPLPFRIGRQERDRCPIRQAKRTACPLPIAANAGGEPAHAHCPTRRASAAPIRSAATIFSVTLASKRITHQPKSSRTITTSVTT